MTPIQHGLLRHALGLDKRKNPFQNIFATAEGEDTFPDITKLVLAGFMTAGSKIPGGLRYYHATVAGVAAAKLVYEDLKALLDVLNVAATPTTVAEVPPVPFKAGPPPNAGPAWNPFGPTAAVASPAASPPWEE